MRAITLCFLILSFAGTSAFAAEVGDLVRVTLKSGKAVTGTVLEETEYKLVLKTSLSGISFEKTYAKSDMDRVETLSADLDQELASLTKGTPAPSETPRSGGYAIVPARGAIGEELTAGFFEDTLERARREETELVIFHLDSPGGLVYVLDQIRDVLDEYDREMEIAFYIDSECFSAAALLSMSAEHMYVGPGARFGAAVGFSWNDSGNAQVDAKFNSALAATWRAHAEKHGRPGILIDAMILPEVEIYADTSSSPWVLTSDKPESGADEDENESTVVRIDSRRTILSITYEQASDLGAVDGTAPNPAALVREIEIEQPDHVSFDGESHWDAYQKRYRTNTKAVDKAIEASEAERGAIMLADERGALSTIVARGRNREALELRRASPCARATDVAMRAILEAVRAAPGSACYSVVP